MVCRVPIALQGFIIEGGDKEDCTKAGVCGSIPPPTVSGVSEVGSGGFRGILYRLGTNLGEAMQLSLINR